MPKSTRKFLVNFLAELRKLGGIYLGIHAVLPAEDGAEFFRETPPRTAVGTLIDNLAAQHVPLGCQQLDLIDLIPS